MLCGLRAVNDVLSHFRCELYTEHTLTNVATSLHNIEATIFDHADQLRNSQGFQIDTLLRAIHDRHLQWTYCSYTSHLPRTPPLNSAYIVNEHTDHHFVAIIPHGARWQRWSSGVLTHTYDHLQSIPAFAALPPPPSPSQAPPPASIYTIVLVTQPNPRPGVPS